MQTDAQLIAALNSGNDGKSLVRSILAAKTLASSSPLAPATTGTSPRPQIPARAGAKGFFDSYRLVTVGDDSTEYYVELPYNPLILGADLSIEAALLPLPTPTALRPIIKGFGAPVAIVNPPANLSQWIYRLAKNIGATIALRADPLTGRNYVLMTGSIGSPLGTLLSEMDGTMTGGG